MHNTRNCWYSYIFATNIPIRMKISALERRNQGEFLICIRKEKTTSGSGSICAILKCTKIVIFVSFANIVRVPSNLKYSYIIGGYWKIIKICIDQTGNDVKMATENFSYIFIVISISNIFETPSGIWCDNIWYVQVENILRKPGRIGHVDRKWRINIFSRRRRIPISYPKFDETSGH